jgi:hypothetical protein
MIPARTNNPAPIATPMITNEDEPPLLVSDDTVTTGAPVGVLVGIALGDGVTTLYVGTVDADQVIVMPAVVAAEAKFFVKLPDVIAELILLMSALDSVITEVLADVTVYTI